MSLISQIFNKVDKKIITVTPKKELKVMKLKKVSPTIKIFDPVGLQIIKSIGSPPSKGNYKKFNSKPCKDPKKVRNPKTGRCVSTVRKVRVKKQDSKIPKIGLQDKNILKNIKIIADFRANRRNKNKILSTKK